MADSQNSQSFFEWLNKKYPVNHNGQRQRQGKYLTQLMLEAWEESRRAVPAQASGPADVYALLYGEPAQAADLVTIPRTLFDSTLTALRKAQMFKVSTALAEATQVPAQGEMDARDAVWYRWLRDLVWTVEQDGEQAEWSVTFSSPYGAAHEDEDDLDAAISAAMAAQPDDGGSQG